MFVIIVKSEIYVIVRNQVYYQWRIQVCVCVCVGGGVGGEGLRGICLPFLEFFFFFFTKATFAREKLVLNEYEVCLKLLKRAILETQICTNFWGSMALRPLYKAHAFGARVASPPPFLKSWIHL